MNCAFLLIIPLSIVTVNNFSVHWPPNPPHRDNIFIVIQYYLICCLETKIHTSPGVYCIPLPFSLYMVFCFPQTSIFPIVFLVLKQRIVVVLYICQQLHLFVSSNSYFSTQILSYLIVLAPPFMIFLFISTYVLIFFYTWAFVVYIYTPFFP